jgi:uncharacterized protein (TIGR03083 family)
MMRPPDPVFVLHLFPEERSALLELLSGLSMDEWQKPTVCAGWSVKDVALHILGGDLGNVSRRRDGFRWTDRAPDEDPSTSSGQALVAYINRFNNGWVEAARRLSPRVLIDLLRFSGPQLFDYFASLNLAATGGVVSWAGLDRAPVWLDVAREYTERWLHQQHIRDAVGKPGLTDRRFMAPVLATFVHALPFTFQEIDAPPGSTIYLHIRGEAGGDWAIAREGSGWTLYSGVPVTPDARVGIDQSIAWKLLTKGIAPEQAEHAITFGGDRRLGTQVLKAVAIIA